MALSKSTSRMKPQTTCYYCVNHFGWDVFLNGRGLKLNLDFNFENWLNLRLSDASQPQVLTILDFNINIEFLVR